MKHRIESFWKEAQTHRTCSSEFFEFSVRECDEKRRTMQISGDIYGCWAAGAKKALEHVMMSASFFGGCVSPFVVARNA
jgi:Tfp pilus assembly protein PilV